MTQIRDMAVVPVTDAMVDAAMPITGCSFTITRRALKAALAAAPQALANRDAPGLGSSAKADTHRDAEGSVVAVNEFAEMLRLFGPCTFNGRTIRHEDLMGSAVPGVPDETRRAFCEVRVGTMVRDWTGLGKAGVQPEVYQDRLWQMVVDCEAEPECELMLASSVAAEHAADLRAALSALSQQAAPLDDRTGGDCPQENEPQNPTKEGSES